MRRRALLEERDFWLDFEHTIDSIGRRTHNYIRVNHAKQRRCMKDVQSRRGVSRRAFIAHFLACVLILQGAASVVSHERGWFVGFDSQTEASVEARSCGADATGDNGAPVPRHDHSQCCIVCSSSVDGGLIRFAAALFDLLVFPIFDHVTSGRRFLDEVAAPPTGPENPWSSRAPPAFLVPTDRMRS